MLLTAGMMRDREPWEMMDAKGFNNNPAFQAAILFHVVVAVLFLVILLFVAMLLWEKIQTERQKNGRSSTRSRNKK